VSAAASDNVVWLLLLGSCHAMLSPNYIACFPAHQVLALRSASQLPQAQQQQQTQQQQTAAQARQLQRCCCRCVTIPTGCLSGAHLRQQRQLAAAVLALLLAAGGSSSSSSRRTAHLQGKTLFYCVSFCACFVYHVNDLVLWLLCLGLATLVNNASKWQQLQSCYRR
jgi:uncharacterized membrane protein YbjE (DUF340 family)